MTLLDLARGILLAVAILFLALSGSVLFTSTEPGIKPIERLWRQHQALRHVTIALLFAAFFQLTA